MGCRSRYTRMAASVAAAIPSVGTIASDQVIVTFVKGPQPAALLLS